MFFYWSHWGPHRKCTLIVKQPLYTLLSLYSLLAPLTAHIFAYMYMHPFMGFQRTYVHPLCDFWPFRRRVKPYGFSCRFADEWSLMGFSYRFVVSDAIWDFQFISQRWTPFEFWRSFAAFRPLRVCLTFWVFIYLFIYSFIHLLTLIFIYLFICLFFIFLIDWLIDWCISYLFTYLLFVCLFQFIHSFFYLFSYWLIYWLIIYLFIDW